jgi:hypothetical protein
MIAMTNHKRRIFTPDRPVRSMIYVLPRTTTLALHTLERPFLWHCMSADQDLI